MTATTIIHINPLSAFKYYYNIINKFVNKSKWLCPVEIFGMLFLESSLVLMRGPLLADKMKSFLTQLSRNTL